MCSILVCRGCPHRPVSLDPTAPEDFILVGRDGVPGLGFSRLAEYQRPTWPAPEQEKRAHLDFGVDNLDTAQAAFLALGATEPASQPQPDRWRVLFDPAGHPFCISTSV